MQHSEQLFRRRSVVIGAIALAAGLAGCGVVPSGATGTGDAGTVKTPAGTQPSGSTSTVPSPSATPSADPVVLTPSVADGETGVEVDTLVSVKAAAGTVTKVRLSGKVTDKAGKTRTVEVAGDLSDDQAAWKASDRLDPGVTYTLVMDGTSSAGAATTTKSSFTTRKLTLAEQTYPTIFPLRDTTVGIGMPVILTFDVAVRDKKSFEKQLAVTSSPSQKGTWHWYSDKEVHYRPEKFWKPGTKVTVTANLNGVSAGNGIYGQNSTSTAFTIGRSVVTRVDLKAKTAKVYVDGALARTIPVSGGKPDFVSRSGTKLIMAKLEETRMASETIGINKNSPEAYDLEVKYALRVTSTGEFLHAAPWNSANFGRVNASHGCIGMGTDDARWLFNQVKLGDPVVTTGTSRGLEQGNGWTDWDISYRQYAKGSAA